MLQYLNQGCRTFGKTPIPPHTRLNWEFYAVIEGKCAPVIPGQPAEPLKSRRLWVFSPAVAHGWRGVPDKRCRVFCFHFAFVLSPLDSVVQAGLFHACDLDDLEINKIIEIGQVMKRHYEHPTNFTHLHFQKGLIELSMIALKNINETTLPEPSYAMNFKVQKALAWYVDHLPEAPSIKQVAAQIGASPGYLRKMFLLTRKENPLAVFRRVRLQRAMELLSESDMKLDAIASQCGYVGASDFCRAFKHEVGIKPSEWRHNDYSSVANAQVKPVWRGADAWDLKKPFTSASRR